MDDLISRQKMREAMYHEAMEKDSDEQKWDGGCWIRYKMFERVVESLPSAQPERQKGAWLEYIPEHGKCPFCGNQVDLLGGKANNFCGECGADMRGEQDEQGHHIQTGF